MFDFTATLTLPDDSDLVLEVTASGWCASGSWHEPPSGELELHCALDARGVCLLASNQLTPEQINDLHDLAWEAFRHGNA